MKKRLLPEPVYSSNEIIKVPSKKSPDHPYLSRNKRHVVILLIWSVLVLFVDLCFWNVIPDQIVNDFYGNNFLFRLYTRQSLEVENNGAEIRIDANSINPFQVFSEGQLLINAETPANWVGNVSEYSETTYLTEDTTLSVRYERSSEDSEYVLVKLTATDLVSITLIDDQFIIKLVTIGILSFFVWLIGCLFISMLHII